MQEVECWRQLLPFSQGLQAAHPAQDELRILFVHVNLFVVRYQGIFPLVQLLIPGGLDFLAVQKKQKKKRQKRQSCIRTVEFIIS